MLSAFVIALLSTLGLTLVFAEGDAGAEGGLACIAAADFFGDSSGVVMREAAVVLVVSCDAREGETRRSGLPCPTGTFNTIGCG